MSVSVSVSARHKWTRSFNNAGKLLGELFFYEFCYALGIGVTLGACFFTRLFHGFITVLQKIGTDV